MTMIFDTLKHVELLKKAGFTHEQAVGLMEANLEILNSMLQKDTEYNEVLKQDN